MPATVRLLQITDLHLRADPQGALRGTVPLDSLRACLKAAACQGPYDAILVSGDLAQDEPDGYAHLQRLLGRSTTPVVCLPGNHDEPAILATAFSTTPFQTLGHLQLGAWLLIALDSTVPNEAGGRLAPAELARLQATLTAHPDTPTLVALHHPPVPLASRWLDALGLAEATPFWTIIDRHPSVRAVLFGHAHQAHESQHGAVAVLGAPATCVQFLPGSDDFALDDRPPGWRVLDLAADGTFSTRIGWLAPDGL